MLQVAMAVTVQRRKIFRCRFVRRVGAALALPAMCLLAGGCDLGPAKSAPTAPASSQPSTAPATAPASQPTTQPQSAPSTQPAPEPVETAEVVDVPPPEFVRVQSKADVGKGSRVLAKVESQGRRLTIDTENVTQLEIRRDLLDLPRDRSIVLYLDGQLFEWTRDSRVTEFRRSPAGVWTPVRGR